MTPIPTVQKFRPLDLSLPLLQCYTWGRNNHGQLGLAGASQTSAPRAVSYLTSGASRGAGGVGRHVIKVNTPVVSTPWVLSYFAVWELYRLLAAAAVLRGDCHQELGVNGEWLSCDKHQRSSFRKRSIVRRRCRPLLAVHWS